MMKEADNSRMIHPAGLWAGRGRRAVRATGGGGGRGVFRLLGIPGPSANRGKDLSGAGLTQPCGVLEFFIIQWGVTL